MRIEVFYKKNDSRAKALLGKIKSLGYDVSALMLVDAYTFKESFPEPEKVASVLHNPVVQSYSIDEHPEHEFDFALEIGFLPGVTDNIGSTASELVSYMGFKSRVSSSQILLLKTMLDKEKVKELGKQLANELIQKVDVFSKVEFYSQKQWNLPEVKLVEEAKVLHVDLNIGDDELLKLGKEGILDEGKRRGPLALDLDYLKTIKKYFEKLGRNPTDVELECLAQTWSEHCKHTIFSAKIDYIEAGIFKHYIKRATEKLNKDFCVSVFKDNSGGILFDEEHLVTHKVETHNSPSALDPFGGAITGIVGVNRDCIGFGLGAMPLINVYGFCLGLPEDKGRLYKGNEEMLSPKRIMDGVIAGVNSGGNCSGIPAPQGFLYFDPRYKGKPLVFAGTVGIIPTDIKDKKSHEKKAQPGDLVVVVGGRVGKDGIHGATFSSEALSSGSPATAVQIGDPITQKKLSDAIVKEARDLCLYNSMTDCGAGGISCSVSEMARESGGFEVFLDKVPLKYPGLQPWEIWISESQERMTLAVPEHRWTDFKKLMDNRGVEATVIGRFDDSGKAVVKFKDKVVMDIGMDFLHDGLPKKELQTEKVSIEHKPITYDEPADYDKVLLDLVGSHNIASFSFVSTQYDHEVQGGSCMKPLVNGVNNHASITKPVLGSNKAVVLSQGICSRYSESYHMAACAIDTAIRNNVSVGGALGHMALLDNFCWCSSDEPFRLGQLVAAAKACYDNAVVFGTPFISGKDSMFNDFRGEDKDGNPVKISIPPTLLISSISVVDDVNDTVSMDVKCSGDLIYVLGDTKQEVCCSEYAYYLGKESEGRIPVVNALRAKRRYMRYLENIGLIASCIPVNLGGIGIALSKMCLAGGIGCEVDIDSVLRPDMFLFSETQSRLIVTIYPKNRAEFEEAFENFQYLGVVGGNSLIIKNKNKKITELSLEKIKERYQRWQK